MQAMEYNLNLYQDTGAAARKEAKDNSTKFMGNPLGKKPDVMIKSFFFRFASTMKFDVGSNETLNNAWKVLQSAALAAGSPECDYVATRCFRVSTKGTNEHKWIFFSQLMVAEMAALRILMQAKAFEGQGVYLERDHAPRSAAVKDVQALLFPTGGNERLGGA